MAVIDLVSKPTFDDTCRTEALEVLDEVRGMVERGEASSVVVIFLKPGGWGKRYSSIADFSGFIGRLEITKQELISQYVA